MVKKNEKIYSRNEIYESTLEYFNGDELATEVWINKYCLKDSFGNYYEKNPNDMHKRIAKELYRIENKYPNPISEDEIFETLKGFNRIVPQGSPMSGIGNDFQVVSLSNCFVIGNGGNSDSYGGIFKIDQEIAQLQKRRAGVGTDLSYIRPKGSPVKNSALTSTGIVPFMERHSNTTKEVAQDGRRGALMLTVSIKHPDAEDFIDAKLTAGKVTGANVSVRIDDEFMNAVKNNTDYIQTYPVNINIKQDSNLRVEDLEYNKLYKNSLGFHKKINARKLWNKIIYNAWKCVPYDTEIMVYENNVLKKIKIGELYDKDKDKFYYEIPSLNLKTRKIEKKEISDFQKYKNDKDVYEIKTESLKSASATEDHIFYLLDNESGLIKECEISKIKPNDYLIVSNRNKTSNDNDSLGVVSLLKDMKNIHISTDKIKDILHSNKEKFGKYNNGEWKINSYIRYGKIPINIFHTHNLDILLDEILLHNNKYYYYGVEIPDTIKLNNEILFFIGLFYAEGDMKKNCIRLSIHKNEIKFYQNILDEISKTFKCNWNYKINGNSATITFHSSFLVQFFNLLKIDKTKKIFELLWSLKDELIGSFLNGLFSGDSAISKNGVISISQNRKYLINDIHKLLITQGIHGKIDSYFNNNKIINNKVVLKNSTTYRLTLYKQYNDLFYKKVGFVHEDKKNILSKYRYSNTRNKFGYPIKENLKEKLRIFENSNISQDILDKQIEERSDYLDIEDLSYINRIKSDDVHYEKVISVEKKKKNSEFVYDLTVNDNHTFMLSNGIVLSNSAEPGILFWDTVINESIPDCYADLGFKTVSTNPCGEITLSESDSCRLLALNLYGYVANPFTSESYFDWDLFKKDVMIAQRYMDDIVDLEIEKIDSILNKIKSDPEDELIKLYEYKLWEKIKSAAINGRRTGLGITAEGDMLAALGFTYGTDEANNFSENIHKTLKLEAYRSSVILAKERGAFPIYDNEREDNNPFIERIKSEDIELYTLMQEFGRRNIALLTIAPTGTVSIMTQTTSGIEPVFMPVYKRRRKINPNDKDARIDFIDDEGISWQEYPVFHHKFETWLEVNGYDLKIVKSMTFDQVNEIVKKSPYNKATANDVDWVKKVEMQGMVQKNVDHSISVTVNLPNDISEEMVAKVYETGWNVGCKGITVYRDGSRSGVLISDSEKKEKEKLELFQEIHAPKRPKRLKAEIIRFQNNLEKWIAVVGLMDGRPYEIFTGKLENGLSMLPTSVKECEVVKNIIEVDGVDDNNNPIKIKKKRYDIEYIDSNKMKQIHTGVNHAFNPEYWNYAKLISGNLRHGMPLVYVYELVSSLNLRDDVLNTWKNGMARVIKRYIKDGEKMKGLCPECGSDNLEFVEGCLTCKNCGSGRCG